MKPTDIVVAKVLAAHNALTVAGGHLGNTIVFSDRGVSLFVASAELVEQWQGRGGDPYPDQFRLVVGPMLKRRDVVEKINAWGKR